MSFIHFDSSVQNPEAPTVNDVTPEEVNAKKAYVKLIDVRQPDEFTGELGHIPNSTLIPLDQLEQRASELPKDQTIIFVCRSGRRSITASLIAQQYGVTEVFNMLGGMIRWNELSYETER